MISFLKNRIKRIVNCDASTREFVLKSELTKVNLISKEKITGDGQVIVSLTTYGKRIHDVFLTIETICNQTIKPKKVILWLDENEFDITKIPNTIKNQISRGLDVKFCKNYKSYKKLIPTLNMHQNEDIITIDDDVFYPHDFVENLLKESSEYPNTVLAYRCKTISLTKNDLSPYKKWKFSKGGDSNEYVMPTGIGGVFYPRNCFHIDVTNEELFMNLSPSADDIWFKCMTLLNGTKSRQVKHSENFELRFVTMDGNQDVALFNSNVKSNDLNYIQLKKVIENYEKLGKILLEKI